MKIVSRCGGRGDGGAGGGGGGGGVLVQRDSTNYHLSEDWEVIRIYRVFTGNSGAVIGNNTAVYLVMYYYIICTD